MTIENWQTSEHGHPTFTHEGWVVEIWGPEWPHSRISVTSPIRGAEVEVNESGVWVKGESETSGWEGPSPEAFTIPWPVIAAISAAQAYILG
jgi:hypothetical protein